MVKNFFKVAWRNLSKNKTFSFINIFGLAIGLACFILIGLFVLDDLSYDRFHKNADRIYRINGDILFGGTALKLAVSSDPMGPALKKDYPEVEQFTRVYNSNGSKQIRKGDLFFKESAVAHADSTFFEIFTFPALHGNPLTALNEPNTVVLSESMAKKYFGRTDVVGESIETDEGENNVYKVTAVISDMPRNSHMNFGFLFSMDNVEYGFGNFLSHNFHTYLLLKPGADPAKFNSIFADFIERYVVPQARNFMNIETIEDFEKAGNKLSYSLMPLRDIYLKSDRFPELGSTGNIRYVYIFSAVAIFILLLACINFVNLSTANSGSRAREIGIRKVLGSEKAALVGQFLAESLLTAFWSCILAFFIVWASLGLFNEVTAKALSVSLLLKPVPMLVLILLAIVTGLIAGLYPAFYVAAFKPIAALKGKLKLSSHKSYLRNGLVVFQFATAIILMVGTVVVYKQLKFIQDRNIGYEKEQVLVIDDTYALGSGFEAFKNALEKMKGVESVATGGYLPVSSSARSDNTFSRDATMSTENSFNMQNWRVDYNYIPTLGMEMAQGRNFSRAFGADSTGIIINEACAQMIGGGNVIGKKLYYANTDGADPKEYTVVGVVKNFNYESLRENVRPLSMVLGNANWATILRVKTDNLSSLIALIESTFKGMASGKPFIYRFLDDSFNEMYRNEERMGKIALAFAVLAICIACLGLFGLATFMAQQRVKEIGVRKVLGASVIHITGMLSADFVKLVLVAAVIAFPVAWYAMNSWLQDFAFRTNMNWWIFALAGSMGLLIALGTVSYQAIKAALTNPVKSLRTE